MNQSLATIGRLVYKCRDCVLVPSDYYYGDGRMPSIDKAFDAGREWWTLPYGTVTMGEVTFPISADFIPCDAHLATIHEGTK